MRRPRPWKHAVSLAALAIATMLAGSGCTRVVNNNVSNITIGSAPYTEGSGKLITQTRALADFGSISVENGVTVVMRHGAKSSVDVTADDNLTALVATEVAGGKLTIRVTGSLTTHNQIRLDVTAALATDSIAVDHGSTLDVEDLSSPMLQVAAHGGSSLRAGGKVISLHAQVGGGSTADLRNVEAKTAEVSVEGGSTTTLNVSDVVSGTCHGGSTLSVSGGANAAAVSKDAGSTVSGS
jgi:hypothetical protein